VAPLSLTKNTTNFAGLLWLAFSPDDVNIIGTFVEGLTRGQSHFFCSPHVHHD
jgi:hypothetical protein